MVQIRIFLDHPYTLKKGMQIAIFSILTPEQTKHIRPVNPTPVRQLLNKNYDDALHYINSILKTSKADEVNKPTGSQRHTIRAMRGNTRPFGHVFSMNYVN